MGNFLHIAIHLLLAWRRVEPCRRIVALAGGFAPKSSTGASKGGGRGKRKQPPGLAEFQSEWKSSELVDRNAPIDDQAPILDKWGLPFPSEDDVFPPMPPETEFIPVPNHDNEISLQMIKDLLKDYIALDLERFDDFGVEKDPVPGRRPMKLRLLHSSPPVLAIEDFMTESECAAIMDITNPENIQNNGETVQVDSKTLSILATSVRTSTSWFCHFAQLPTLVAKARYALGIPIRQMEEPQVVRYRPGEQFSWHYDEIPQSLLENGGQRVATLLVYLNNVTTGGGTIFRDLKGTDGNFLKVSPRKGLALLFFPAFVDGRPDDRTLHKGEIAFDTKWICQMWIHQYNYTPVTPPGNSHEAATVAVDEVAKMLGYVVNSPS